MPREASSWGRAARPAEEPLPPGEEVDGVAGGLSWPTSRLAGGNPKSWDH